MTDTTVKSPNLAEMHENIVKAGGVFYQYRPCRRNAATIYDIENIRHGVVYAQTPLNMNDPFDSTIGFSADAFFDDCIQQIMEVVTSGDSRQKALISLLLKYKVLGKMGETIHFFNKLKAYVLAKQKAMHQTHIPIALFINQNLQTLYSKSPKEIKQQISYEEFIIFSHIVGKMEHVDITAQNVSDMLNMDNMLDELYNKAVEVRDKTYLPTIRSFLSQLTVSCFSASGWNNQLMWAHYANSYSGICIEYDFSQIKDFRGFIYPVKYSDCRPTLKLKDLGISISSVDSKAKINKDNADMNSILSYLLYKNSCWSYEDEWRIINIGEEYTPTFIKLPYIKSITFGLGVDNLCKQFLWDVCKDKGIPCYQLKASIERYELERFQLTEDDFLYDADNDIEYIQTLSQHFNDASSRITKLTSMFPKENYTQKDFSSMPSILSDTLDMIADSHFIKLSINRVCDHSEEELQASGVPQNIIEAVEAIDTFIDKTKASAEQLNISFPGLFLGGALKYTDYQNAKQSLLNILESIEKYLELPWNSYLVSAATNPFPPK